MVCWCTQIFPYFVVGNVEFWLWLNIKPFPILYFYTHRQRWLGGPGRVVLFVHDKFGVGDSRAACTCVFVILNNFSKSRQRWRRSRSATTCPRPGTPYPYSAPSPRATFPWSSRGRSTVSQPATWRTFSCRKSVGGSAHWPSNRWPGKTSAIIRAWRGTKPENRRIPLRYT